MYKTLSVCVVLPNYNTRLALSFLNGDGHYLSMVVNFYRLCMQFETVLTLPIQVYRPYQRCERNTRTIYALGLIAMKRLSLAARRRALLRAVGGPSLCGRSNTLNQRPKQ